MKYIEMIKMAEQARILHTRNSFEVVKPLSFEDKAEIANLLLYGGTVYEGAEVIGDWEPSMRWQSTQYFWVVVAHGSKRAIPLPWVSPWSRLHRRAFEAWQRNMDAWLKKEESANV